MTAKELQEFIAGHFPHVDDVGFRIEQVAENFAQVRMVYHAGHLRPGGTISGPSLMMLADTAMYMAILGMIGPVAMAVTTNLNINFLRRPKPADVIARATLLKLGSRLAVGEVRMYSDGEDEPVAHATVTYSIPPSA
ncbi:MAG: PaaI family thioesterase [Acidobacteriota bacterium]|nr:MAG: PaaI family thioesterase [Acidobacteriota bacterium]